MKKNESFNGAWIVLLLLAISVCIFLSARISHSKMDRDKSECAQETVEGGNGPVINEIAQSDGKEGSRVAVAKTPDADNKLKQPPRIIRRRLEPEATKRLSSSPQKIRTVLTTTGRAENSNWGVRGMCTFVLTHIVDCDAEIVEKSETPGGEIKVVEKRTFNEVGQVLQLSETDVALSLYDTLPLKEVFNVIKVIGTALAVSGEPEMVAAGETLAAGGKMVDGFLRSIDGKSVRGLLGMIGVSLSDDVEKRIDEFVNAKVKDIFKPSFLRGKSYLLTYYQDKESGAPLRIDFTYADGSDIRTQEEYLVLRRANAFMDSKFVPDKYCSPGDTWTVDSSEFDCLLDPYVEGAYCGDVTVERLDNDKDGDWILGVRPCNVSIKSDAGRTSGELRIEKGQAKVDAKNVFVKAMVVTGKGAMKNLTTHHLLFKSRFGGECTFRGVMTTVPLKK